MKPWLGSVSDSFYWYPDPLIFYPSQKLGLSYFGIGVSGLYYDYAWDLHPYASNSDVYMNVQMRLLQ